MTSVARLGRLQLLATLLLAVSVAVLAYFSLQNHAALCTFRDDLNRRAAQTADYIEGVKAGDRALIPGFTLAELERVLANQNAATSALDGLDRPFGCW